MGFIMIKIYRDCANNHPRCNIELGSKGLFFLYVFPGLISRNSICHQGSHSSWKTWKNGDSFSSLEKSWNFVIFDKYPGKMRQTLEI